MFTGLVEGTCTVKSLKKSNKGQELAALLVLQNPGFNCKVGDSIAIDGCCLTVSHIHELNALEFFLSCETLKLTNLDHLKPNSLVNIERAMQLSARLDGHIVSGHIDSTGVVTKINKSQSAWEIFLELPKNDSQFIIKKGSISVNGVSLTINTVEDYDTTFQISICLIPTTLNKTNLKLLKDRSIVNIEYDLIGKYVNRIHGLR